MLFNSFTYLLFLPIVVASYWLLPRACRRYLLLLASYIFYMSWIPAYGLLIATLTVVNYLIGLAITHFAKRRKPILILGLLFNLGALCFYKYANFLIKSAWDVIGWLQADLGLPILRPATSPVLEIILPLGISFFTFEFIHYITDVYRGSAPVRSFGNFALFAAFFPSQIAGPIKRFQDFVKQLVEEPLFNSSYFKAGLSLIFLGLIKKVVLGDNIGQLVGTGYGHVEHLGTMDAWITVVGFHLQIFFDFSGYTDIGRGSALLLGYKVPENFNCPYLAWSVSEFWRRWHMSLSSWLRDYLFIPLGGSRNGLWRARRNLLITMVLGGLWHGAAWHYVIWGACHGAGLVLTKEWQNLVSRLPWLARLRPHPLWHWSGVLATGFFVLVTWILFRAENTSQALAVTQRLFALAPSGEVTEMLLQSTVPVSLAVYAAFLLLSFWHDRLKQGDGSYQIPLIESATCWWQTSVSARIVFFAALSIVILGFAPGKVEPFIYFQF